MHNIKEQYFKSKIPDVMLRTLLFVLFFSCHCKALTQTLIMGNGQTLTEKICMEGVDICDDGGPNGNYGNDFDGSVYLYTTSGADITLSGTFNVETNYDYITVFDGTTQIATYTGSGSVNLVATSGAIQIVFHSDGSVNRSGFQFHASAPNDTYQCHLNASNLNISNLTSSSCTLTWEGSGTNLLLDYGNGPIPVSGNSYNLTGLNASTNYIVRLYEQVDSAETCCSLILHFRTPLQGGHGCIDPTNLTAPYVQGYYGYFNNPYSFTDIVDHGPNNANSRHTVHTNPNERDYRTGNLLSTVPPGGTSSVRLGNWESGGQAEAILYAIEIDTMVSDLLILKYAAVLEDPNHEPDEQPRFRLEILDANMEVIDPDCGVADFIANANLGWNVNGSTLWKDWTTVGIDLNPYAGQTIMVRLTTYDCAFSAHFGYAYFTLECSRKSMASESCGDNTNNTFTVPAGFNYLWYTDSPSNPISTSQSLNVTADTTTLYHCQLSFVDKPQCNFTMSATAGIRYPLSLFDTTMLIGDCQFDINFLNRSTISNDGVTPSGSGESCETAWWDFGNGDTSSLYHASTHYDAPGTYIVTLISTIANGACADTLQMPVNVMPPGPNPQIIGPTDHCEGTIITDTLLIQNAVWNSNGSDTMIVSPTETTTYTVSATDSINCTYTLKHTISIHPIFFISDTFVICTSDLPFTYKDSVIADTSDTVHLLLKDTTVHGCDSTSSLHLTIHPTFDHHTYDTICSNQSVTFADETYDTTGVYPHSLLSVYNCDSLATLHLLVWPAYDNHAYDTVCDDSSIFFVDSAYRQSGDYSYQFYTSHACDSLETLHLTVYPTYGLHFYDTIYDGDIFSFESNSYDTTGTYPILLAAAFGCDSLRTLHLQRNRRTYNDSTLCQNSLPLVWNGVSFSDGGGTRTNHLQTFADSVHLSGLNGIDSLVVMQVTAIDTSSFTEQLHTCDTLTWRDNQLYSSSTNTPFLRYENQWGCDSILHLDLTVDNTHHFTDHRVACDSLQWIDHQWYLTDTLGPLDTIMTNAGCDSIVTLDLAVRHATYEEFVDTFCHQQTYHWRSFNVSDDSAYLTVDYYLTDTLRTVHNCDSVLALRLTKMAQPRIDFSYEIDCHRRTYTITAKTDAGYIRWSAFPDEPDLEEHKDQLTIRVSPSDTTAYSLYADYHETPLCPTTSTLTLHPVEVPDAILQVSPEALKYNAMDFTAYDISNNYDSRIWYLDSIRQSETSRALYGQGSTDVDTITISLAVFNGQCYDTAVYHLPILRVGVFAPNAFTPNLDINNRFVIVSHGVIDGELYIYNREGLLVYQTSDFGDKGWDGGNCPQGNYVWKFLYHAIDYPNSLQTKVGTILLIR